MFSKDWPKQEEGSADLLDSIFSKILMVGRRWTEVTVQNLNRRGMDANPGQAGQRICPQSGATNVFTNKFRVGLMIES